MSTTTAKKPTPVSTRAAAPAAAKTRARTTTKGPTQAATKPVGERVVKSASKPVAKASAPAKRVATVAVAPARPAAASAEPSLRFFHSKALRQKTNAVLDALEAHPTHRGHADAVADLVSELVEAGMDYYFLRALKMAEVGFVTEQSARLGMSGAVKLVSSVSAKFIRRMDHVQLLVVASHIRALT